MNIYWNDNIDIDEVVNRFVRLPHKFDFIPQKCMIYFNYLFMHKYFYKLFALSSLNIEFTKKIFNFK